MDSFFTTYPNLEHLRSLFISNVKEDAWFAMTNEQVCSILSDDCSLDIIVDFISKYNFEKGIFVSSKVNCDSMTESMEVAECTNNSINNFILPENLSVCESSMNDLPCTDPEPSSNPLTLRANSTNSCPTNLPELMNVEGTESFQFKKNKLYYFLNSTLEGQIILGVYQNTKELLYARLKHLIVLHLLSKSPLNFRIKPKEFLYYRDQIVELFPTEKEELFYVPYNSSKNEVESEEEEEEDEEEDLEIDFNEREESTGASGSLYNYYKLIRKYLRKAGILQLHKKRKIENNKTKSEVEYKFSEDSNLTCLTDKNTDIYKPTEITQKWEETFKKRSQLLLRKEKGVKIVQLSTYFISFPCLQKHGIMLLESDFQNIIEDFGTKGLIPKNHVSKCANILQNTWPILAKKIIVIAKKSRSIEVKQFFACNKDLVSAGTHDDLLAFFLIPLCIKATKTRKIDDAVVNLTKKQISDCFIFHVKNVVQLDTERKAHENWLRKLQLNDYPYVLCCGELDEAQFFVVLNDQLYKYANVITAVETCFKCLCALRVVPYICDFVWHFLQKCVYEFNFMKSNAFVAKFIVDLNKVSL